MQLRDCAAAIHEAADYCRTFTVAVLGDGQDEAALIAATRRIKAATRKVLNAMAHAQKNGINITALGGFSSIIFETFNLQQIKQIRNLKLEFERFTTGNTHTAYILCRQVEEAAPKLGI